MARPVLPLNGSYHKVSAEIADTKEGQMRLGAKEKACGILSNNSLPVRIYFDSNTKRIGTRLHLMVQHHKYPLLS